MNTARTYTTYIIIAFILLAGSVQVTLAERPTVVVFPLAGDGVSSQTARLVTERIRHELGSSGRVRILERDQIDRILETIGRNLDDCTEEGCGIEIGRQLDAEKIVVGEVSRIGKRITILANYIDVATTEREISARKDLDEVLEEHLTDYVPDLVQQLINRIPIEGRLLTLSGDTVLVDIGSETGILPGSVLIVEDRRPVRDPHTGEIKGYLSEIIARVTILNFPGDGISRGLVSQKKQELEPGQRVRLADGVSTGTIKADVTFLAKPGDLFATIDGNPSGVITVPLSGKLRMKFNPGPHRIILARSGFQEWNKEINVSPGQNLEIDVEFIIKDGAGMVAGLGVSGILIVNSDPSGAVVYIDNIERGITPYQAKEFIPGTHEMEIIKPFYIPHRETIVVEPDAVTTIETVLSPNFGRLEITSIPADAMVEINGQQRGTTPLVIERFSSGMHTLRVIKPMYHDYRDEIVINTGKTTEIGIELKPAFGSLKVFTSPSGAEVYLDGRFLEITPARCDTLLSGQHSLRISKELYREVERLINVDDNRQTTIDIELDTHYGEIEIKSSPSDADVTVTDENGNQENLGATPLFVRLKPGMKKLHIKKGYYLLYEESISLAVGDRLRINAILQRETCLMKLFSDPPGAEVYIDGRFAGIAPLVIKDQPAGPAVVTYRLKDHASLRMDVIAVYGKETVVEGKLSRPAYEAWKKQRNRAITSSIILPGKGHVDNRMKRGWIYFFGYTGTALYSYYRYQDYQDLKKDYSKAREAYDAEIDPLMIEERYRQVIKKHDEMGKSRNDFNTGLVTAAAIWTISLVDIIIWGSREPEIKVNKGFRRQTSFYFDPANRQVGIRWYLR